MKLERRQLRDSVLALRGYNITNHGKTPQLLKHPQYGPILRKHLEQTSTIASQILNQQIDLVQITRDERPSTLETYPADLALIIAVELAHVEIMLEELNADLLDCKYLLGYSLGEVTAIVLTGIFTLEQALAPVLMLAQESAQLATTSSMGILFSRGTLLDFNVIERLCLELTAEGHGTISVSTFLSPNTVLLIGQGDTLDRMRERMPLNFPRGTQLRKNPNNWPPLHTPIVRQMNLSNRTAVLLEKTPGGFHKPNPPILSCVTGDFSYTDTNARELMTRWTESPQKLWQALHKLLDEGIETLIHLGPEPNIIPATIDRIASNVNNHLNPATWTGYSLKTLSHFASNRRWLRNLISSDAALLRAPYLQQVVFEDYLLQQKSAADTDVIIEGANHEITLEPIPDLTVPNAPVS